MLAELRVGELLAASGTVNPGRTDVTGSLITTDGHGRLAEATRRGRVFSTGMTLTSISNSTFTTLTNTTTPIVGVWNPSTNTVNLEILMASLAVTMTALQATGAGGFVWAYSIGNTAISTGLNPVNRKTLTAAGSSAKGFANTALTGLTNNLVIAGASSLCGGAGLNIAALQTAAGFLPEQTSISEWLEGQWVIPPGGILALLATTTPVAHSAASMLVWEEVPIQN